MGTKPWVVAGCLALAVGLFGCGSIPAILTGGTTDPSDPGSSDSANVTVPWKVRLIIDSRLGRPDENGLYCVYPEKVSTNPLVSFTLDDSLGAFQSAVITIREVVNGVVALDGIFISDFAAAEEYKLRPRRPFLLLDPGPGVIVGKGEKVGIRRLKRDTTYQIDLVVQGENGHETLPARFTTH
jgi:hypothetical protein